MDFFTKCASCGSAENLKKCAECKGIQYCSRECQISHWRDGHKGKCDSTKRILKTHAGPVTISGPMPQGVPSNFSILVAVHAVTGDDFEANLSHESALNSFYEEIVSNEQEWFTFFHFPHNLANLIRAQDILFCLSLLYYFRCDSKFGNALEITKNVIRLGKQHHKGLFRRKEYAVRTLEFFMNAKTGNFHGNVQIYRRQCIFEILHPDPVDQLFISQLSLLDKFPIDYSPTARDILTLGDDEILLVINEMSDRNELDEFGERKFRKKVKLLKCEHCNAQATAWDEFNLCPRCQKVAFCGKKCLEAGWKAHKKVCGGSKRSKSTSGNPPPSVEEANYDIID